MWRDDCEKEYMIKLASTQFDAKHIEEVIKRAEARAEEFRKDAPFFVEIVCEGTVIVNLHDCELTFAACQRGAVCNKCNSHVVSSSAWLCAAHSFVLCNMCLPYTEIDKVRIEEEVQ